MASKKHDKPQSGGKAGDSVQTRAKRVQTDTPSKHLQDAKNTTKEQNRCLNRQRRQLTRLAGIVSTSMEVERDEDGKELKRTAQDAAALTRTIDQLHQMERKAHGLDKGEATAPGVLLLPIPAASMEDWQRTSNKVGVAQAAQDLASAGRPVHPIEDDIQGEDDVWGTEQ